ncbi:hypothetical protein H8356DRAFT_1624345 [Neocallimastix lanati (nom. inval.)]|nr:hypothetical protein H8356DRAFT_1624345 [Neocallimastix sp. JGI-2020a]
MTSIFPLPLVKLILLKPEIKMLILLIMLFIMVVNGQTMFTVIKLLLLLPMLKMTEDTLTFCIDDNPTFTVDLNRSFYSSRGENPYTGKLSTI